MVRNGYSLTEGFILENCPFYAWFSVKKDYILDACFEIATRKLTMLFKSDDKQYHILSIFDKKNKININQLNKMISMLSEWTSLSLGSSQWQLSEIKIIFLHNDVNDKQCNWIIVSQILTHFDPILSACFCVIFCLESRICHIFRSRFYDQCILYEHFRFEWKKFKNCMGTTIIFIGFYWIFQDTLFLRKIRFWKIDVLKNLTKSLQKPMRITK